MGSETPLRVPIVDFSGENLTPGSHAWAATRAQLWAALDSYGCFEAVYGGLTPELRDATFAASEQLFALPLEAKLRNASDKPYHGYVGQISDLPYESLAVDDALSPAAPRDFTHLMWPQGNPRFCETICEFAGRAADLDRTIRRGVLESMGVEDYCDAHMESTKYVLRFSEYGVPGAGEAARLTLQPHVDGNLCTLIYQNQVHGLEVQARSGDWVPVAPSSPSSFVFVAGDALRAWSNDRVFSPPHRVRVAGRETRYCVMLFAVPLDETVIEAPAELVREGRPRLFKPYRYPDYVKYSSWASWQAAGADLTSILPDFCGTAAKPQQPEIPISPQ
uniref:2-oxoglutarate-dependent dioxygenase DAO n=1 Tax=Anthurium amnicola TaxID=1678845 RepID=A0A1D1Y3H9_9ARAE